MEKFYLNQIFLSKEFGELLSKIILWNEETTFLITYDPTVKEFQKHPYDPISFSISSSLLKKLFSLLKMYLIEDHKTENIFSLAKQIFSLIEIILKEEAKEIEIDKLYQTDLKLYNNEALSTHAIIKFFPLNLKINLIYKDNKIDRLNFILNNDSVILSYFHNIRAFISKNICQLFIYIQEIAISGSILINEANEKYFARANNQKIPLLKEILNFKRFIDLSYDNLSLTSFKIKTMFESDVQIINFIDYVDLINRNYQQLSKKIHLTIYEEKFLLLFIYAFNSNESFYLPDKKDLSKLLDDCFSMITAEESFLDTIYSWGIYRIKTILGCLLFTDFLILREVEKRIISIIDESTLFYVHTNKLNNYKILVKKNKALANKKPVLELIKKDIIKFTNIKKFILDVEWLEDLKNQILSISKRIENNLNELKEREIDFSS
jgi:hypothetical protein